MYRLIRTKKNILLLQAYAANKKAFLLFLNGRKGLIHESFEMKISWGSGGHENEEGLEQEGGWREGRVKGE